MPKAIIGQLRHALPAFKKVDWLVVADEYPPKIVGGAEISLHEVVKGLGEDAAKGLVVKIMADEPQISFYRYSGVQVLKLPRQATWRAPGMTAAEYKRALKKVRPRCLLDAWQIARLLLRYGMKRCRLDAVKLWVSKVPKGGILTDALPEQYALNVEFLKEIVGALSPRVVLANNTRSIVSVYYSKRVDAEIWNGVKTIAMVRDNRFHCARHNQIMRVRGTDCVKCAFQCASEDAKSNPAAQTRLLRETKEIRRLALESMDMIAVTSVFLEKQIAALVDGVKPIRIMPNLAGDPDEVFGMIKDVVQRPNNAIAVIGALNEAKGQREFLENSLPHLEADRRLEIHFIGRGPQTEKALRDFTKKYKLEGQVKFRGFLDREQLYTAIRACKVVSLPTLWPEPSGRVPLEAALCGRPVVAFSSGGLTELIRSGETGFLVEKGDYDNLWRRIHELLLDGELRYKMAANARSDILETHSKSSCINEFRKLLAFQS